MFGAEYSCADLEYGAGFGLCLLGAPRVEQDSGEVTATVQSARVLWAEFAVPGVQDESVLGLGLGQSPEAVQGDRAEVTARQRGVVSCSQDA